MAKREHRYDRHGRIRLVARAEGYVMARRPGCAPFVLTERKWDSMDREPWSPERIAAAEAKGERNRRQAIAFARLLGGANV